MQNYQNNYQDALGNAIPGAVVVVRNFPSNTLATIYSDNGVTPLPNPTTTDSLGMFNFFAANGVYSVTCTKAGFATKTFSSIQLFDASSLTSLTSLTLTGTTNATSPTIGSLVTAGGAGIAKNLYVAGKVYNQTDFAEYRLIPASSPTNLNGWRIFSQISGATDGSFSIQHTNDNFGANAVDTLVFSPSGVVTATNSFIPHQIAGIVGTTTNNNVNAGGVGEFVNQQAIGVSVSSGVAFNVTSISLTAGDWDVRGNIEYVPAGGTSITQCVSGSSPNSVTLPGTPARSVNQFTASAGFIQSQIAPTLRYSLAATSTVYLVGFCSFSGGTLTASGYIAARRVR